MLPIIMLLPDFQWSAAPVLTSCIDHTATWLLSCCRHALRGLLHSTPLYSTLIYWSTLVDSFK
jgi:hypothetical protein